MIRRSLDKLTAEMIFEVLGDFVFDKRFQKNEHQTERGLDSDLILTDSDRAVYTASLKMNMVTLPAEGDCKFFGQVACQLVGSLLRFGGGHRVLSTHINIGHRDSVDVSR